MKRFGEKLHSLRIHYGLTLSELASELGYNTHSYISELESGRKQPTAIFVLKVARLFHVTTDELMKDELRIPYDDNTEYHIGSVDMAVVFAEREPSTEEIERFRLILSTYQDGTGMLAVKENAPDWVVENKAKTMPGWRDYERAVAVAFYGRAIESKWLYDVVLPDPRRKGVEYGISCKMRGELRKTEGYSGRAHIELTNASGELWDVIKANSNLTEENYSNDPEMVGRIIVKQVEGWHINVDVKSGGNIDSGSSFFLSLMWDRRTGYYQIFQFPIDLPEPSDLNWYVKGRSLIGETSDGIVLQWYGFSGGQLKYYPLVADAVWQSDKFQLQKLPEDLPEISVSKAATYFPQHWSSLTT